MIRHHTNSFEEKKQTHFDIDEKKLVKSYIYVNKNDGQWI